MSTPTIGLQQDTEALLRTSVANMRGLKLDCVKREDVISFVQSIAPEEILKQALKIVYDGAKFENALRELEPAPTAPTVAVVVAEPEVVDNAPQAVETFTDPLPQVPQGLKSKPNWVLWKLAQVKGKITKVPYKLDFKNAAASTRPEDWSDYKSVAEKIAEVGGITEKQGIGRVVQKSERIVGIDLDGCRDPQTGAIAQWAEDLVAEFNSYCEITPSQTGLRIWVIGDLPAGDKVFNLDPAAGYFGTKVKIEIFTDGRYFTVTGQSQFHSPLRERDLTEPYELINAIRRKHPAPKKSKTNTVTTSTTESTSVQIEKLGQFDTNKYDIFMRGEITSREPFVIGNVLGRLTYPSQSEADYAFATVLAYYHKGDREKMSADFRASNLYRDKWDRLEEPTFDKVLASIDLNAEVPAPIPLAAVPERTVTQGEIDASIEEEYPIYELGEQSGPRWEDEWMFGVAGDIVRKAGKHCEAHPAGMFLDLIVSLGNIMGRSAYFNVGASRHHTNEFMIRVGNTSVARKGTGRDAINEPLKLIDGTWYTTRVLSGFGSGEAVIGRIADPMQQKVRDKKVSTGFSNIFKPGVDDKRLFIREGEAASVFQLAGKKESRADIILRDGWDGLPLQNLVKGATDGINNSALCQEPHLSISGDTTRDELKRRMPDGADQNGFGNRFLFVYVSRVKMCPNGGPQLDWTEEVVQLHKIIQFARGVRYVPLTKAASKMWHHMYVEVEEEIGELPPLAQSMCARGVAHIRRLALIFALLDMKSAVDSEHLQAAKRLWDYCMDSARFIFGGETKEQLQIINWMRRNPGAVTVRTITDEVFNRHRKVEWVKVQMSGLVNVGKLIVSGEDDYSLKG
jgi:hypothetical protein